MKTTVAIISVAGLIGMGTAVQADAPEREPYQPPWSQRAVQGVIDGLGYTPSEDALIRRVPGMYSDESRRSVYDDSAFDPAGDWIDQSRPGYRPEPTPQSVAYYRYIMEKVGRGEELTWADRLGVQQSIATRTWPEAPEITAGSQAVMDWAKREPEQASIFNPMARIQARARRRTSDAVWQEMTGAGLTEMDTPPTEGSEAFRQYWHSLSEEERQNLPLARMMRNWFARQGFDMRSDEQRALEEAMIQEREQQRADAIAAEREEAERARREEKERQRLEEQDDWFRQAWEENERIEAERAAAWEQGWDEFADEFEQLSPEVRDATWEGMDEQQRAELERRVPLDITLAPKPDEVVDAEPSLHRHVSELSEDELRDLLNCLCRASLGAAFGVQAGYNLNPPPPEWSDSPSCASLANGPCMARGFGCWRRFIDFSSEAARNCLAGFGLDPDSRDVIDALDRFNQEVEEDLQLTLQVEPREVCPGDEVRVRVVATGGRGNYRYSYSAHPYFLQQDLPERVSRQRSFTLTVDPTLTRGERGPDGYPIYTRPLEGVDLNIRVSVDSPTFSDRHNAVGRSDREGNMRVVQAAGAVQTIRLRPHRDCVTVQAPPTEPKDAPPDVAEGPPTAPPPRRPPAPPQPPTTRPPPDPTAPPTTPPRPPRRPPTRPPTDPDDTAPPAEPDEQPAPPAPTDEPPAPTEEPDAPRAPDTPPEPEPDAPVEPDKQPPEEEEPTTTVRADDCGECLIIGGGAESQIVIVAGADGRSRPEMRRSRFYSVEGCPGQTVRLTVVGTDGFNETAEGIDGPVIISRSIGEEAGEDTITAENLSLTDCSRTWTQAFGPGDQDTAPSDLRDAEATASPGPGVTPEAGASALDIFGDGREADRQRQREDAAMTAQQQLDMTRGARAGDQQVRVARQTRDAGGRDAQQTRADAARDAARTQRDQSWGTVLGDAVTDGVQTGMETFADTLGREAADQVSRDIFGPTREEREAARQPAPSEPAAAPKQVAAADSAAPAPRKPAPTEKTAPTTEPAPEPSAESEPEEPPPDLDCDLCDSTAAQQVTMGDGSRRPLCATCKDRWTCSECNQITLSMGGASYTAYDETGAVVWTGSIEACGDCSDAWYREQQERWEN